MRNRPVTYVADVAFQALADPTRRAILDLLRGGARAAGDVAGAFPVSRPAISRHLRLLRRARLVKEHRRGRHRYYALDPAPLKAVSHWVEQYRVFWISKLASLKTFVEAQENAAAARSERPSDRRKK